MFRTLIYTSSGACDCAVELPTAPNLQHTTDQEQKTDVVIQQHSRKLLMMDILTLQRGVTGTARMLHALTHSSISRQVREQM